MTTQKYHNWHEAETEFDNYISEICSICEEELINENDIFVTTESDQYICYRCMEKYNISAVECFDISIN